MGGTPTKVAYIDALRGYAVVGVVSVHAANVVPWPTPVLQQVALFGARGVQLFYIASALTMCMSWQARHDRESTPLSNFYLRRVFRIVPMYWLAIAGYLALFGMGPSYWAPNGIHWWAVLLNALCLHGLHPEAVNAVVPGGWSIAVEMAFYLFFPLLALTLRSLWAQLGLLAFSLLLYAASRRVYEGIWAADYPATQQYLIDQYRVLTLSGQLPVFALGLLTYSALSTSKRTRQAVGALGVLGYLCLWPLVRAYVPWSAHVPDHLSAAVGLACFALLLSSESNRILTTPSMIALGGMSYSIYLVHFAVITGLAKLVAMWALPQSDLVCALFVLTALVVSAAISVVTYLWLELPCIALGKRVIERLHGPAALPK